MITIRMTDMPEDDENRREELFRAWNKLEEALNALEDLDADPFVGDGFANQEIRGVGGSVAWSDSGRWVRGA